MTIDDPIWKIKFRNQLIFSIVLSGLLIAASSLLDPNLGIICILVSCIFVNKLLLNNPFIPRVRYILFAAISMAILIYLLLGISCAFSIYPICSMNYGFFSFFPSGLIIISFFLQRLFEISCSSKKQ